jgi:deoxyribodipyrimidine photo-lyase
MAPRQAAFLATHLNALQQALAERGIPLIYREVDDFAASVDTVAAVCAKKRSAIFSITTSTKSTNASATRRWKSACDVACQGFDDSVMLAPGSVVTGNHEMYKVFTPFKNAFAAAER